MALKTWWWDWEECRGGLELKHRNDRSQRSQLQVEIRTWHSSIVRQPIKQTQSKNKIKQRIIIILPNNNYPHQQKPPSGP